MTDTATETAPRHKRGGLYFEGFVVGSLTEHRYYRTVTQMDNMLFSNMTLNPQPLHIDRHFCETETEWGQPLMNSLFTLGLMIGMQVSDMTVGTTIANLGMQEVKFGHPVFEGDTLCATTEVIGKRESKSWTGTDVFTPQGNSASGRAANRFQAPTWNELRGLTPDERRIVLEYFKRINGQRP